MSTIETKTYPMYNHCTSKIVVGLRDTSVVIDGGTRDCPTAYPFTLAELQQIASTSPAIQEGYLRPAPEDAEFIYETLRIRDWKNILTEEDVEKIILHPTVEGLTKLINIKDAFYYERIYGIFIGLKNVNAPIAANVDRLLRGRYKELQKGKINTEFVIRERDFPIAEAFGYTGDTDNTEEINALRGELEDKDKLIEQLKRQLAEASVAAPAKTAVKSVKRKTTAKKTTEV